MAIVAFNVNIGRSLMSGLSNLPALTVALSQAVIHKANLSWLDVDKLQQAFPKNVQVLNDDVVLQGPVMLMSSVSPVRRLFIQGAAFLVAGLVSYSVFSKIFIKRTASLTTTGRINTEHMRQRYRALICGVASVAFAGVASYASGRFLPTKAGVYFFNAKPFYA